MENKIQIFHEKSPNNLEVGGQLIQGPGAVFPYIILRGENRDCGPKLKFSSTGLLVTIRFYEEGPIMDRRVSGMMIQVAKASFFDRN